MRRSTTLVRHHGSRNGRPPTIRSPPVAWSGDRDAERGCVCTHAPSTSWVANTRFASDGHTTGWTNCCRRRAQDPRRRERHSRPSDRRVRRQAAPAVPARLRRCLSSALGHQPGAHRDHRPTPRPRRPAGHHDSLVGQHGPTEPDLVATTHDPGSTPRRCDRTGEIGEHRGAGHNGTVVTSGETTLDRVHRVVGMLGKVDRRDRPARERLHGQIIADPRGRRIRLPPS